MQDLSNLVLAPHHAEELDQFVAEMKEDGVDEAKQKEVIDNYYSKNGVTPEKHEENQKTLEGVYDKANERTEFREKVKNLDPKAAEALMRTMQGPVIGSLPNWLREPIQDFTNTIIGFGSGLADVSVQQYARFDDDIKQKLEAVDPKDRYAIWDAYSNATDVIHDISTLSAISKSNIGSGSGSITEEFKLGNYSAAAQMTANQSASGLASLVPFFVPGGRLIGPAVLGLGATASAFEADLEERPEATMDQIYNASYLKGGTELATEFVTGGLINKAKKVLKNVPPGSAREASKTFLGGAWKRILGGSFSEFVAEGLADTGNQLIDHFIYGDEIDTKKLKQGFLDSGIIGAIVGGKVSTFTELNGGDVQGENISAKVLRTQQQKDEDQARSVAYSQAKQIAENTVVAPGDTGAQATVDAANDRANSIVKEQAQADAEHKAAIKDMTPKELKEYAEGLDKISDLELALQKFDPASSEAKIVQEKLNKLRTETQTGYDSVRNWANTTAEADILKEDINKEREKLDLEQKKANEAPNPNPVGNLKRQEKNSELDQQEDDINQKLDEIRPDAKNRTKKQLDNAGFRLYRTSKTTTRDRDAIIKDIAGNEATVLKNKENIWQNIFLDTKVPTDKQLTSMLKEDPNLLGAIQAEIRTRLASVEGKKIVSWNNKAAKAFINQMEKTLGVKIKKSKDLAFNQKGQYKNGEIILNENYLDLEALWHEAGHLWSGMVLADRKALYEQLINTIKTERGTEYNAMISSLKNNVDYAGLDQPGLDFEVVARFLEKGPVSTSTKLNKIINKIMDYVWNKLNLPGKPIRDLKLNEILLGAQAEILTGKSVFKVDGKEFETTKAAKRRGDKVISELVGPDIYSSVPVKTLDELKKQSNFSAIKKAADRLKTEEHKNYGPGWLKSEERLSLLNTANNKIEANSQTKSQSTKLEDEIQTLSNINGSGLRSDESLKEFNSDALKEQQKSMVKERKLRSELLDAALEQGRLADESGKALTKSNAILHYKKFAEMRQSIRDLNSNIKLMRVQRLRNAIDAIPNVVYAAQQHKALDNTVELIKYASKQVDGYKNLMHNVDLVGANQAVFSAFAGGQRGAHIYFQSMLASLRSFGNNVVDLNTRNNIIKDQTEALDNAIEEVTNYSHSYRIAQYEETRYAKKKDKERMADKGRGTAIQFAKDAIWGTGKAYATNEGFAEITPEKKQEILNELVDFQVKAVEGQVLSNVLDKQLSDGVLLKEKIPTEEGYVTEYSNQVLKASTSKKFAELFIGYENLPDNSKNKNAPLHTKPKPGDGDVVPVNVQGLALNQEAMRDLIEKKDQTPHRGSLKGNKLINSYYDYGKEVDSDGNYTLETDPDQIAKSGMWKRKKGTNGQAIFHPFLSRRNERFNDELGKDGKIKDKYKDGSFGPSRLDKINKDERAQVAMNNEMKYPNIYLPHKMQESGRLQKKSTKVTTQGDKRIRMQMEIGTDADLTTMDEKSLNILKVKMVRSMGTGFNVKQPGRKTNSFTETEALTYYAENQALFDKIGGDPFNNTSADPLLEVDGQQNQDIEFGWRDAKDWYEFQPISAEVYRLTRPGIDLSAEKSFVWTGADQTAAALQGVAGFTLSPKLIAATNLTPEGTAFNDAYILVKEALIGKLRFPKEGSKAETRAKEYAKEIKKFDEKFDNIEATEPTVRKEVVEEFKNITEQKLNKEIANEAFEGFDTTYANNKDLQDFVTNYYQEIADTRYAKDQKKKSKKQLEEELPGKTVEEHFQSLVETRIKLKEAINAWSRTQNTKIAEGAYKKKLVEKEIRKRLNAERKLVHKAIKKFNKKNKTAKRASNNSYFSKEGRLDELRSLLKDVVMLYGYGAAVDTIADSLYDDASTSFKFEGLTRAHTLGFAHAAVAAVTEVYPELIAYRSFANALYTKAIEINPNSGIKDVTVDGFIQDLFRKQTVTRRPAYNVGESKPFKSVTTVGNTNRDVTKEIVKSSTAIIHKEEAPGIRAIEGATPVSDSNFDQTMTSAPYYETMQEAFFDFMVGNYNFISPKLQNELFDSDGKMTVTPKEFLKKKNEDGSLMIEGSRAFSIARNGLAPLDKNGDPVLDSDGNAITGDKGALELLHEMMTLSKNPLTFGPGIQVSEGQTKFTFALSSSEPTSFGKFDLGGAQTTPNSTKKGRGSKSSKSTEPSPKDLIRTKAIETMTTLKEEGLKGRVLKILTNDDIGKGMGMLLGKGSSTVPNLVERVFVSGAKARKFSRDSGLETIKNAQAGAKRVVSKQENRYVDKYEKTKPNGKPFYDIDNITERSSYSYLNGQTSFSQGLENLRQSAENGLENRNEKVNERAKAQMKVYNDFKSAESIDELQKFIDPININAVNDVSDLWSTIATPLFDVANAIGDIDTRPNPNYTRTTILDGSNKNRLKSNSDQIQQHDVLPEGGIIDTRFDSVQFKGLETGRLYMDGIVADIGLKAAINSDEFVDLVGDPDTAQVLREKIESYLDRAFSKPDPKPDHRYIKAIWSPLSRAIKTAYSYLLGGFVQPIKQYVPALVNILIIAKGRMSPQDIADSLSSGESSLDRFINGLDQPIANRGLDAYVGQETQILKHEIKKQEGLIRKAVNAGLKPLLYIEKLSELKMRFLLANSDRAAARASYATLYRKSLREQGIEFRGWDAEGADLNETAADYAQAIVDKTQNVSEADLMGEIFASDKTSVKAIKSIAFPFGGFSFNQKQRILTDTTATYAKEASTQDKTDAWFSLAGAAAEIVTYQGIGAVASTALVYLAAKALGYGDDETEELIKENVVWRAKIGATGLVKDFNPMPVLDVLGVEAINYFGDIVNPDQKGTILLGDRDQDIWDRSGLVGMGTKPLADVILDNKDWRSNFKNQVGVYNPYTGKTKFYRVQYRDRALIKIVGAHKLLHAGNLSTPEFQTFFKKIERGIANRKVPGAVGSGKGTVTY